MDDLSGADEGRSRERLQGVVRDAYEIGGLIGRGGFAEVFEATDPTLGRSVAIKVIRPDLVASAELVERFQREARAMASLRHPHIMDVYTVGEADGVAYFVMPLVRGETLAARLEREGALPIDVAERILAQAAGALAAAHGVGVVHRDIKPDNILLEGAEARVVIADFGIAKALELDGGALTGTGMFVGTPRYMSPEQAVGDALDHRSDVYSLGVVAFRMIAGRLPFEASSTQALIAQHLTEDPTPLSTLRSDCPGTLAHAIHRCLAKDPGERWDDLGEMVDALSGAGGPSPAGQRPEPAPDATAAVAHATMDRPLGAFHRRVVLAAAVVAAAALGDVLVGLGGWSAWIAAIAAFYLAAGAGRLWRAGHEWRDMLSGLGRGGDGSSDTPLGTPIPTADEGFGRFGSLVHACVSDRAVITRAFTDLPRQEQARFVTLRETTEALLHRVKHSARKVVTLEDRIAEATRRMDGASTSTALESEVATAAASRRGARVEELTTARDEVAHDLGISVSLLEDVREVLTEGMRMDPSAAMEELQRALGRAESYLEDRATP